MIRRRGQRPEEEESSSEEEDAFTALSKKAKRQRTESQSSSQKSQSNAGGGGPKSDLSQKMVLPKPITSSMKRHHKPNDDRKAKMEALLQELEAEKQKVSKEPYRFVPDKKGSFVDPSEEHLTTNIFVGNLAPSITEEDLTELFLQFGELYSVKIMWPRTPAERSRKRNTGFVCFMNREDADEAMEACNEADPFDVGRLLMMRWGKNVKRNVRQGTGGGINIQPLQRGETDTPALEASRTSEHVPDELSFRTDGFPSMIEFKGPDMPVDLSKAAKFQPALHSVGAITVVAPPDPERFRFISTVASFIATDGSQLERKLIEAEGTNPDYAFLKHDGSPSGLHRDEHIFYRWRVYSFCQGDSLSNWRTEPFVMFHPNGRFWIPPPLDRKASSLEKERDEERSQSKRRQKDQRAEQAQERREFLTGRQIERARVSRRKGNRRNMNWEVGMKLSTEDRDRFNWLVRKKLTISRESICTAMAFCFEKSGAAQEIAALLKDSLEDDAPHVTVDMRIARLYLLSDILFNSQQPGVRNAFMYRDALEKMAPDIFTSLGRHGSGRIGRMTLNKIRNAVSSVLGAWTEWSVYNPAFLDELEARFSGKEIQIENKETDKSVAAESATSDAGKKTVEETEVVITQARGDWTEVAPEEEESGINSGHSASQTTNSEADRAETHNQAQLSSNHDLDGSALGDDLDGAPIDDAEGNGAISKRDEELDRTNGFDATRNTTDEDIDGDPVDEDIDGVPMEDEGIDGVPLEPQSVDVDGEALDADDIDGEPMDDEVIDGVPLKHKTGDVDGQCLDSDDIDGEPMDDEVIDGVPMEAQTSDVDGEALDSSDIDGEPIDDEGINGVPLKSKTSDVDGEVLVLSEIDGEVLED